MTVPVQFLQLFQDAINLLEDQQTESGKRKLLIAEELYHLQEAFLSDYEKMMIGSAMGNYLQKCGYLEKALYFAKMVCEFAVKLEPVSPTTFGDFWTVAELYEQMGRFREALQQYEEIQTMCQEISPQYYPLLQQKVRRLKQKKENAPAKIRLSMVGGGINYALVHCGMNSFQTLTVFNDGDEAVSLSMDVDLVGYSVRPSTVECLIPAQGNQEIHSLVKLNLDHTKLQGQVERARARIRIKGSSPVSPAELETWVLAYNEFSLAEAHAATLAAFVHPNNVAITMLNRQTGKGNGADAAAGVKKFLSDIYTNLQLAHNITYDIEPPCWESKSQRVRFPDEILVSRRGTCLDLSLLFAGLIENGLLAQEISSVVILLKGNMHHAIAGCWMQEALSDDPVIRDKQALLDWIAAGKLFVFEATGIAQKGPFWADTVSFAAATQKGIALIEEAASLFAVNIGAARVDILSGQPRITPLPFRNEPPFGETALKILHLSQEAWTKRPTVQLQSTHLLVGLLALRGVTKDFFDLLSKETGNDKLSAVLLQEFVEKGLSQKSVSFSRASVQETDGYKTIVLQAKHETKRHGDLIVDELHLLFSLLRHPGASIIKVLRLCGTTTEECLSYLELLYPTKNKPMLSEFPSEII